MDLITIDLRDTFGCESRRPRDLWGARLPVEIVAEKAGTISYDLTCGMTKRVLFVEDEA